MSDMYTDEDIDDLIRINIELTKENNKMLRAMRRAQVWGTIWKVVWFAIMIGVPIFLYYYYVEPYVAEMQATYAELQENVEGFKEMQASMPEWMQAFLGNTSEEQAQE